MYGRSRSFSFDDDDVDIQIEEGIPGEPLSNANHNLSWERLEFDGT